MASQMFLAVFRAEGASMGQLWGGVVSVSDDIKKGSKRGKPRYLPLVCPDGG